MRTHPHQYADPNVSERLSVEKWLKTCPHSHRQLISTTESVYQLTVQNWKGYRENMKNKIIYGECCALKMLNEGRVKRRKCKTSVNVERADMFHRIIGMIYNKQITHFYSQEGTNVLTSHILWANLISITVTLPTKHSYLTSEPLFLLNITNDFIFYWNELLFTTINSHNGHSNVLTVTQTHEREIGCVVAQ